VKIAHLILAHSKPQMLERLVKRLRHPDADIYIQLDKKSPIESYLHIANNDNVYFVPDRVKTEWCAYSTIEAELAGMRHILQTGVPYSHINLLSGQDYPLRPLDQFHQFLADNTGKTFIHTLSIADDEWLDGKARIVRYHMGDYDFKGRYVVQNIANRILPDRKMPGGLKPYGRSQWLTITPEDAQYGIDYIAGNPKLKQFFRLTFAVDEIFFQTILENSPQKKNLVNDNLRYIESFGANPPTVFTMAHTDTLVSSKKFFARKFDENVDTEIFNYLDKVIGYTD
jgi:Core-2/I-Branching enzyme